MSEETTEGRIDPEQRDESGPESHENLYVDFGGEG
jgi:hypothetical protein